MTAWTTAAVMAALAAHDRGDFTGSARLAGEITDKDAQADAARRLPAQPAMELIEVIPVPYAPMITARIDIG